MAKEPKVKLFARIKGSDEQPGRTQTRPATAKAASVPQRQQACRKGAEIAKSADSTGMKEQA